MQTNSLGRRRDVSTLTPSVKKPDNREIVLDLGIEEGSEMTRKRVMQLIVIWVFLNLTAVLFGLWYFVLL